MSALAKSISRVAWSYVFLYLDVNIGVVVEPLSIPATYRPRAVWTAGA